MEVKDYITIGSVLAVAIGWFVNNHLSRRNEISKKKLEYRLPALKAFLKIWNYLQDHPQDRFSNKKEYTAIIEEVREGFQLYGMPDEIELFESFIKHETGEQKDFSKAKYDIEKLNKLVRERIRGELGIK
ncbi:MAG: hypothetical protein E6Q24_05640 [Chitinophagaceae bacterium]|nr:MAG: hypothetical protein E6Q24_05640 [Chitinophagaceae bacterium]